jgi:Protein of unknown function (DUF1559)
LKTAVSRLGALALVIGAAACDSGSDATPQSDSGVVPDASTPSADAAIAKVDSPLRIRLDVGGPYTVAAGKPVTLSASYGVEGQADQTDDLAKIAAALRAYAEQNGSFPPAALADGAGKPLLSWRVLLLPYLGRSDLYVRFDFSKAWDDPANAALVREIPDVYTDGSDDGSGHTDYAGVSGGKQIFAGASAYLGGGVKPASVTDGTGMTIGVGPVGSQVTIPWTSPGDVAIGSHLKLGQADGFAGNGGVCTPLAFLDGKVFTYLNDLSTATVKRWSTLAGDGCDPPMLHDISLRSQWDLDGDGTFETLGATATYSASQPGEHNVTFRVIDGFGGVHATTAKVVVQ